MKKVFVFAVENGVPVETVRDAVEKQEQLELGRGIAENLPALNRMIRMEEEDCAEQLAADVNVNGLCCRVLTGMPHSGGVHRGPEELVIWKESVLNPKQLDRINKLKEERNRIRKVMQMVQDTDGTGRGKCSYRSILKEMYDVDGRQRTEAETAGRIGVSERTVRRYKNAALTELGYLWEKGKV